MHILLTVVVINIFVLLLCGLISLSNRFFNPVGKVDLRVNDRPGTEIDCGQSLFSALAQTNIYLPAACGGKGSCGRCLVKATSGAGPLMPLESINLTPQQIAAAMRLACQIKVRGPIELVVADDLLGAQGFVAELCHSETVSEDIKTLVFKLEPGVTLQFKPGQYLQVFYQLPWEKAIRAYSLASDPAVPTEFALDVQQVEGGLMSNYLHQLQIGQKIEVCGPFGEMFLQPEDSDKAIVLVAGGVGLAPMRSLIAALRVYGFVKSVTLFHGVRSRKNLYGEAFFSALAEQFPHFNYVPALSNPMIEEGWVGERGMIHEAIARQLLPGLAEKAFVCGPTPMMQAVTKVLVAKGLPSDRIMTDPFDF